MSEAKLPVLAASRFEERIRAIEALIELWGVSGGSISSPPDGYCKVTNIFVDPATGKLVVIWDNDPANK